MFHWEIIWSFLQGSLGLTQKQHCIRCRFYKVYLINYKTTTLSFFSFSFFFGGGCCCFCFCCCLFGVFCYNMKCMQSQLFTRNINTSVSVYTNAEYSWKYLIQPWPWAIDILLWIFFRHIKDKQIMIILYLPAPI